MLVCRNCALFKKYFVKRNPVNSFQGDVSDPNMLAFWDTVQHKPRNPTGVVNRLVFTLYIQSDI